MSELESIRRRLDAAPVIPYEGVLVRCVALLPLMAGGAPDYLFTSGKPNRFNPGGARCVYFSENEETARMEYARRLGTGTGAHQPLGTYFAEVRVARMLDLADPATRDAAGLKARDMTAAWQRAKAPTRAQRVGLVASQMGIAAIRFPSDAARACGASGFNLVLFPAGVVAPDRVRILGPTRTPLQEWGR